jgi:hypothetical protein
MEELEERDGVLSLRFAAGRQVPDDGVIDITERRIEVTA